MVRVSRQRSFDRDTALESALLEFWRHGYEATSIASLTAAMGIRPPSLYAAFGDKRRLFATVVERYRHTRGTFSTRALAEEPTGRAAIARLLRETAAEYSDPEHPPGCMIISAAVNCGPESADVQEAMRGLREDAKAAIKARVDGDVAAGLLPSGTDTGALAVFYASVIQGMSVQARDGIGREDLERVADLAMLAWPGEAESPRQAERDATA
ncbi:TetR/AcrR family transcriptional regulator [Streptosporangium roseum]|uniref:Transcriptional regulator, TetR family n=1 Tax=Streptosporangium roseum (strain ATCC 12428 / DSM 43021 / JCM 3005 / KCTC 9067 / NCIMB 10171 / NRRL 2505 / NI 9100) TaxID=479432 RepID=D2B5Y8_STRRD|nr:putative transcriptional regulator, TetR family [Streptosporangium roseum DSM 43021]